MEENKEQTTIENALPASMYKEMNRNRISKIFAHMAITAGIATPSLILAAFLVPTMAMFVQFFVVVLGMLLMIAMVVFTIGLIFLDPSSPLGEIFNFISSISAGNEIMIKIANICFSITRYVGFIGIALSIASIVLLAVGREKGRIGKIVFISILIFFSIISIIVNFIMGGVLWS